MNSEKQNKIIVFESKSIRSTWHNNEWWYAIADIVSILTDSKNPTGYLKDMRRRDKELAKGWGQIATPLSIETKGGKQRVNCANTEGIFRIIQSIPSPKAEPFKRWLAKVGYERVQEIENPELAAERARKYYQELGYSDDWIAKRIQSIEIRGKLTDEWKNRQVQEGQEYAILTAEISKATFGLTPSMHKNVKKLDRENLRDHMTDLELIFTMLGEASTREKTIEDDAQGFLENKKTAQAGGRAAGKALDAYEQETGKSVVSNKNFKHQIEEVKKRKSLKNKS